MMREAFNLESGFTNTAFILYVDPCIFAVFWVKLQGGKVLKVAFVMEAETKAAHGDLLTHGIAEFLLITIWVRLEVLFQPLPSFLG